MIQRERKVPAPEISEKRNAFCQRLLGADSFRIEIRIGCPLLRSLTTKSARRFRKTCSVAELAEWNCGGL